jgi:hypothetical protein
MRKTEASGWMTRAKGRSLSRTPWFWAIALGVGLVVAAGPVRAGDDDDEDDKTFEEKVIEGIMRGIGGTNMENRGIEYRERSPLVVPPKLDLPQPGQVAVESKVPNWPKDPDEQRRKAAIASRKKADKDPREASRVLMPSELAQKGSSSKTSGESTVDQPGGNPGVNAILSPSQLGYNGGFSGLFGGNKSETAPFKGEPTRESLTQPPTGYQTPSPNFAYGTGPKESLNKEYNPAAGKYGE